MQNYLLKDVWVVNEGKIEEKNVYFKKGRIERMDPGFSIRERAVEIVAAGKYLLPGLIDDQVHFREPGLTHKATIYTESRAAVAGGTTSFMEMPNTVPNALTEALLEEKYAIAGNTSLANYSFFMGTSNQNADEVLRMNPRRKEVCGVKIFMGSSTGDMLVDNTSTLHRIFSESELLIATHCEDESVITANYKALKAARPVLDAADHPLVRDEKACFTSSSFAVSLAKKYNSRLHILHISTAEEVALFRNDLPLREKNITSEVCVHHLHFTAADYERLGYLIKCNPAIKDARHREALWKALLDDHFDVIATDHAPHTLAEKEPPYEQARSGLPLVQHSLLLLLHYHRQGMISLEQIVRKTSHAVADCFRIADRGYLREGYCADAVLVDLEASTRVSKEQLLYKCGWSPFEGTVFPGAVARTFVNGNCVYVNEGYGKHLFDESIMGQRLFFSR